MLQTYLARLLDIRTPLLIACLPLLIAWLANSRSFSGEPGEIAKALLLYLAGFLACLLFRQLLRDAFNSELGSAPSEELGFDPRIFIGFRELVRSSVGVCLMLVWIAGLLYLQENFSARGHLLPLALGLLLTLALSLLAKLWISGVNWLRLPQED